MMQASSKLKAWNTGICQMLDQICLQASRQVLHLAANWGSAACVKQTAFDLYRMKTPYVHQPFATDEGLMPGT